MDPSSYAGKTSKARAQTAVRAIARERLVSLSILSGHPLQLEVPLLTLPACVDRDASDSMLLKELEIETEATRRRRLEHSREYSPAANLQQALLSNGESGACFGITNVLVSPSSKWRQESQRIQLPDCDVLSPSHPPHQLISAAGEEPLLCLRKRLLVSRTPRSPRIHMH
mmetsp:Transcript_18345/g.26892  ORF Transcript_18345/g.26892 Transcript_18345/m.26892 type:complete len:170 (+) Transcript_18345:64-573(+)